MRHKKIDHALRRSAKVTTALHFRCCAQPRVVGILQFYRYETDEQTPFCRRAPGLESSGPNIVEPKPCGSGCAVSPGPYIASGRQGGPYSHTDVTRTADHERTDRIKVLNRGKRIGSSARSQLTCGRQLPDSLFPSFRRGGINSSGNGKVCFMKTKTSRTTNLMNRSPARSGNLDCDCRRACGFRIASVIIAVITTLTLIPTLTAEPPSRRACATPVVEQYGIGHSSSGDIPLRWKAFIPNDGETHPAIIVIHGGGFKGGDFHDTRTDQDLVCAGFCVFDIEYRLAPPGELQGQESDSGRYPEQTDDVATAIRAARNPARTSVAFGRVNGKVGAVGGSGGASHAAYCAAAPTLGGDQLDAAVLLSGAYDFHDPASLIDTRCAQFGADVRNYVGCSPGPACDSDGGLLDLASPYRRFTSSSSPVFIIATNLDPMPPNQFMILVNKVAAVGVPNCEQLLITERPGPDGCTRHSFAYWPNVKDQAIAFLNTSLNNLAPIAPVAE